MRLDNRRSGPGVFGAAVLPFLLAAAPPRPHVVDYTIAVSLDPSTHELSGEERLVWRNPSGDAVPELFFHTYLNAFKNNRSTFLRESGGLLRGDRVSKESDSWGWIDVLSIKDPAGQDLRPDARYVQPDGNDAGDETVLRVPLPRPVAPHGELALTIAFRARLPRVFARTGHVRDYYLVGQWFPKLGVYEPSGMRQRPSGGWNCHAFHAYSEFYADFGRFDVTITVPSRFVVGATGKRVAETREGDRTTYRYVQEDVHDFAWAADPNFHVHEARFDPARDVPARWAALASEDLGRPPSDLALKPVAIRLLLQRNHEAARERYIRSAKESLAFFGLWFGAYPYETLTIVDPPEDAEGSAGMEYPTFFTGGLFGFPVRWPFSKIRVVEDVTIHEFGHQYFYGLVGSNEFEEPWLDEGVNTDAEDRLLELAYGRIAQLPGGVGFDNLSLAHMGYVDPPNLDPIHRLAWRFASGRSYGQNSYLKVGLFLAQLRADLGAKTYARAERAYVEEWSYRHPSTADFFATFERVSGRDLSSYRENLVDGTARLDWSTVRAASVPQPNDDGVFDREGGRVTLAGGRPAGQGSAPKAGSKPELFETTVLFGNVGEWPHAARARLVFEDGTVLDRELPAEARWVRLRATYRSKLAWAAVDPDRANAWEWSRLNDSIVVGSGKGAADTGGSKAAARTFGWVATLVALLHQLLWALA